MIEPKNVRRIHEELDEEVARTVSEAASGTLDDMSLQEAKRQQATEQARLDEFSGSEDITYVGIVNYANDEMMAVVDELEQRIAPPDSLFYEWLETKNGDETSDDHVLSHNEAYDAVNYDTRYSKFLWFNDEAEAALIDLASRVSEGENIVLVCYCGERMMCHRKQAKKYVNKWIEVLDSITEDSEQVEYKKLQEFE